MITPLHMPSLVPHDFCHGWSSSRWLPAIVEVRNIFKGLDLIDRVLDELWMEVHDIVQEAGIKTISMKKEMQKSKMAVWGGLTNSCEKKRGKKQRRKGKI